MRTSVCCDLAVLEYKAKAFFEFKFLTSYIGMGTGLLDQISLEV